MTTTLERSEPTKKNTGSNTLNVAAVFQNVGQARAAMIRPLELKAVDGPEVSRVARDTINKVRTYTKHYTEGPAEAASRQTRRYCLPSEASSPVLFKGAFGGEISAVDKTVNGVERVSTEDNQIETKANTVMSYLVELSNDLYRKTGLDLNKRLPSPYYNGKNSDGSVSDEAAMNFFIKQEDAILVFVRGLQDLMRLREGDTVVDLALMLRNINNFLDIAVSDTVSNEERITAGERQALNEFVQCALGGLVKSEYYYFSVSEATSLSDEALEKIRSSVTDDEVVEKIKSGEKYRNVEVRETAAVANLSSVLTDENKAVIIVEHVMRGRDKAGYIRKISEALADDDRYSSDVIKAIKDECISGGSYDALLNGIVEGEIEKTAQQKALDEMRKKSTFARMTDNDRLLRVVGSNSEYLGMKRRFADDEAIKAEVKQQAEISLRNRVIGDFSKMLLSDGMSDADIGRAILAAKAVFLDEESEAYREYVASVIGSLVKESKDNVLNKFRQEKDKIVSDNMERYRAEIIAEKVCEQQRAIGDNDVRLYGVPVRLSDFAKQMLDGAVAQCAEIARIVRDPYLFLNPVVSKI